MTATTARARARERRRARIEQTALELFRSRGFDRVTVEEVCAAAAVGPATFYRHFGSKEGVVLAYREEFAEALLDAVDAVGALPEPARLPAVLVRFAEFLESQDSSLALRDQIVVGHPGLMRSTLAVQRDMEGLLAAGLARLRGLAAPDTGALLEAGVGILVLRTAVRCWRTGGGSLIGATTRSLEELRGLLCRPS
ncbi:TetR/AcrR family transcriptional regulator [Geodermatophilus sp. SYSU D00691]